MNTCDILGLAGTLIVNPPDWHSSAGFPVPVSPDADELKDPRRPWITASGVTRFAHTTVNCDCVCVSGHYVMVCTASWDATIYMDKSLTGKLARGVHGHELQHIIGSRALVQGKLGKMLQNLVPKDFADKPPCDEARKKVKVALSRLINSLLIGQEGTTLTSHKDEFGADSDYAEMPGVDEMPLPQEGISWFMDLFPDK